jgi:hypothetical protein
MLFKLPITYTLTEAFISYLIIFQALPMSTSSSSSSSSLSSSSSSSPPPPPPPPSSSKIYKLQTHFKY